MRPRTLAVLLASVTFAASLTYLGVYLARWAWQRAIVAGLVALLAEVALVALRPTTPSATTSHPSPTLELLRTTPPPRRHHFAWLAHTDSTHVFVPVLMAAGVVLSALAWLVEHLAAATVRPGTDRQLAHRLDAAMVAPHPLVVARHDPSDLRALSRPTPLQEHP